MRIHQDHDHDHHTMLHRHHDADDGGRGEDASTRPQSRESCTTRLNVLQLFLRVLNWVPTGSQAASAVGFCWVYHSFLISECE